MANPENLEGQGFHTNPERINRQGKPKGTRNRATIVREALEAIIEGSEQQVVDGITAAQIVKALTGDTPAFKELMDSGYGKNPDKTEFLGDLSVTQTNVASKILAELTTDQLEKIKQDANVEND